jgi:hypothetical protein
VSATTTISLVSASQYLISVYTPLQDSRMRDVRVYRERPGETLEQVLEWLPGAIGREPEGTCAVVSDRTGLELLWCRRPMTVLACSTIYWATVRELRRWLENAEGAKRQRGPDAAWLREQVRRELASRGAES